MDKILQQISDYFKDNPIMFWIAVALAAVIVILIIVAIVAGVRKSKAKKNAAVSEEDVPAEQPKAVAAPHSVAVETQKQEPAKDSARTDSSPCTGRNRTCTGKHAGRGRSGKRTSTANSRIRTDSQSGTRRDKTCCPCCRKETCRGKT